MKTSFEKQYYDREEPLRNNDKFYFTIAKLCLKDYFNGITHEKVLDFGCGTGYKTYYLKNKVYYDPSNFIYNYCKEKGIKVITEINELDNDFDIVFCDGVLEYTDNPLETLKQIYSKLKVGGKLIIIVLPNYSFKIQEKFPEKFENDLRIYDWCFISMNKFLVRAGFSIIENKYIKRGGETKLLFLSRWFELYEFLTKFIGFFKIKKSKLIIIAEK